VAKLHEEVVVLKLSKLVKDRGAEEVYLADNEFCSAIEQVAQELAGEGVIVEVERAE
jgi:hypothetical protein